MSGSPLAGGRAPEVRGWSQCPEAGDRGHEALAGAEEVGEGGGASQGHRQDEDHSAGAWILLTGGGGLAVIVLFVIIVILSDSNKLILEY